MDMASGRNVEELVLFLKKELTKTLDSTVDKVTYVHSIYCNLI